ncbi:MAG: hypothetical protein ABGZ35_20150 [Planctomycetaceae bacterium]
MISLLKNVFALERADRLNEANNWEDLVRQVVDKKIKADEINKRLREFGRSAHDLDAAVERFHRVEKKTSLARQQPVLEARQRAIREEQDQLIKQTNAKVQELENECEVAVTALRSEERDNYAKILQAEDALRFLLSQPLPEDIQEQMDELRQKQAANKVEMDRYRQHIVSGNFNRTLGTDGRQHLVDQVDACEAESKRLSAEQSKLERSWVA